MQSTEFEQRVFQVNGNGTRSNYSYEVDTRRLHNLKHFSDFEGNYIQDMTYKYDDVGNITDLFNPVTINSRNMNGPVTQGFKYDDLYRLISGDGTYRGIELNKGHDKKYSLAMTYDKIHNILTKDQKVFKKPVGEAIFKTEQKGTLDYDYAYGGSQPHAPTQIGDRAYSYDLNGNQTGYTQKGGADRSIVWDEENRMKALKDGGGDPLTSGINFDYNDSGMRIIKRNGGNATAYINQFFTVKHPHNSAGSALSKHVFVGNTRILSQVEHGDPAFGDTGGNGNGGGGNGGGSNNGSGEYVTVTTTSVVYRGASTNSQPIGTANSGDVLELLSTKTHNGTMYKVMFQGLVGFIPVGNVTPGGTPPDSGGGGGGTSTSVLPRTQDSHFVFYYHADHLGSTGYLTDRDGQLTEVIQYFPFGETWVEQRRGMQVFPTYEFTGKTLDTETGLYYFGARYYDPRTSVWQSADPALGTFLDGNPNVGVFMSSNLNLYTYASNDPLLLRDVDGKNWFNVQGKYEWHPGKKYISPEGEVYKKSFVYLVKINVISRENVKTGEPASGTVQLFEQNKVIAEGGITSGGFGDGKMHPSTPKGNYRIGLWQNPVKVEGKGSDAELKEDYGIQRIPETSFDEAGNDIGTFRGEWGSIRARLNPEPGQSIVDGGYYLHGKELPKIWTHGCACNKDEKVLRALIDISDKRKASIVPAVVSEDKTK